jgi:hypothetical protein
MVSVLPGVHVGVAVRVGTLVVVAMVVPVNVG